MKVKDVKTGKVMTVNKSYGERLIEQGKAVLNTDAKPVKQPAKDDA